MRFEMEPARMLREHPRWLDAAVVGFALTASFASSHYIRSLIGLPLMLLLSFGPPLTLWWRRRRPRQVFAVVLGFALVQWALAVPINGAQVTALIAVYTVARYDSRQAARSVLGAGLLVLAIAPLRQAHADVGNTVLGVGMVIVVYLIGTNVGLRQAYLQALEERAARLERERDAAAEVAAALERTRIARELHDVVAHHVSVMVVQAEGAGWALDDQPERARTAITAIAQTGRSTLTELRRLLGVLRAGDSDGVAPQPGLADLPDLLEGFRGSGLAVSLATGLPGLPRLPGAEGGAEPPAEPIQLPDSLQLAAFRIVQEGLTNVLKHAGPAARAWVAVRLERQPVEPEVGGSDPDGADELLVEIRDDGGGSAAAVNPKAGHGLVGIKERAGFFGGRVEIGPEPGGGFAVRVRLPVALASGEFRAG